MKLLTLLMYEVRYEVSHTNLSLRTEPFNNIKQFAGVDLNGILQVDILNASEQSIHRFIEVVPEIL